MTVSVSPVPFQYLPNNNNTGAPADGFRLFTYVAGTSTKQATWVDSTQTTQNDNPILLDANGFIAKTTGSGLWLDPTLIYKFVLCLPGVDDPPTSSLRSEDNVRGTLDLGTLTAGLIGSILYPQTAAEIAASVTPTSYAYPPLWVDRYGTNTTPGTTDMTTAIAAAISVAHQLGGGTVIFQASTYLFTTVAMQKNVRLQGAGKNATQLLSTGAGNGITSTWPVNSSTAVYEEIRDLFINNTNGANTGAGFVDIGGSYVTLSRVKIQGFKYSAILCQTEHCDFDFCDIEFPLTAGIWLVNGGDYSAAPTANAGFTNRISFYRCQFNQSSATGTAILDDGGNAHSITDCNFNNWIQYGRFAAVASLKISGGEYESASAPGFLFATTTSGLGTSVGGSWVELASLDAGSAGTNAIINVSAAHAIKVGFIHGGLLSTSANYTVTGGGNIDSITMVDTGWTSAIAFFDAAPVSYTQIDSIVGVQTNRSLAQSGTKLGLYGANPIVQPSSTGNVHTVGAGSVTTAFVNTTWDGSTGSTAYTVGDLVHHLKVLGLIAT